MIKNYTFMPEPSVVMERLMGNEDLLDKMLVKFSQVYGSPEETLNDFLSLGDLSEALRYAHSVKGVSANLGIESLRVEAATLEKRFRENNIEGIQSEIERFGELTRSIVAEIREKN